MKLVGLSIAALASVAFSDKATFEANKAAERARILALKQKAWAAKEAQRQAKDEENASVRAEKDELKAKAWEVKTSQREAKDQENASVREEKDRLKAIAWGVKMDVREMKDRANEIIRARKDAAKANSWEIRQVIRDRKDAMKAVVDFNRATAKAAQAAVRKAFWDIRADQKVNWNVRTAGLRSQDMYCYNTDDVSSTWSAGSNSVQLEGFNNVHQGTVAIGRSSVQSGNYFISVVGGWGDKRIFAVEGEGLEKSERSPYGKYWERYWTIAGTSELEPSNDVLNINVAHAGDSAGSDLTWYLCVDRNDASNPCRDEPCKNGGSCSVSGNDAQCQCISEPVAYEGPTCETCTCENTSDMSSCAVFLPILGIDASTVQGCDFLEHCKADDPCVTYENKCAAMQANCGSGEVQAFVPCVLLTAVGNTCESK